MPISPKSYEYRTLSNCLGFAGLIGKILIKGSFLKSPLLRYIVYNKLYVRSTIRCSLVNIYGHMAF